jgi:hypothetical protein
VLDLVAYSRHRSSLPKIKAAFTYGSSLVNGGPLPASRGVIIPCNDDEGEA